MPEAKVTVTKQRTAHQRDRHRLEAEGFPYPGQCDGGPHTSESQMVKRIPLLEQAYDKRLELCERCWRLELIWRATVNKKMMYRENHFDLPNW